jgi:hypothetical protein
MAFKQPLSQTERDLNKFASGKAYHLMHDVRQAFEIAGKSNAEAGACVGALFLRLAATIAVAGNNSREKFLTYCNECFDLASEADKDENES